MSAFIPKNPLKFPIYANDPESPKRAPVNPLSLYSIYGESRRSPGN